MAIILYQYFFFLMHFDDQFGWHIETNVKLYQKTWTINQTLNLCEIYFNTKHFHIINGIRCAFCLLNTLTPIYPISRYMTGTPELWRWWRHGLRSPSSSSPTQSRGSWTTKVNRSILKYIPYSYTANISIYNTILSNNENIWIYNISCFIYVLSQVWG